MGEENLEIHIYLRHNKTPRVKIRKEKQSCFNILPKILKDEIPNSCLTRDGQGDKWKHGVVLIALLA